MVDDPLDIQLLAILNSESDLMDTLTDVDNGLGFDTMALIVSCFTIISRGHLAFGLLMMIVKDGLIVDLTFGIWFVDDDCQGWFDC